MLCIALALVFVATSAARIVNLTQHDLQLAHEHDHHDSLTVFAEVHDADGERAVDTGSQDEDADLGDNIGGHQHADGPVGFYAADFEISVGLTFSDQNLGREPDRSPRGWPPQGPERPPRHITISA